MGKNKLRKFAEMDANPLVFQYPAAAVRLAGDIPLKGRWGQDVFHNDRPIVLELGCGRGEYTVGLARRTPDKNFIGIDIKGARMHAGASEALREGMTNVAFLRTDIEAIDHFFAPGEVQEVWITFPDPQMQKVRKRLTGTRFIELYRRVLAPDGTVHLKTDSPFLYAYTRAMAALNGLEVRADVADIYAERPDDPVLSIRTHYESQWLARGLTIKYIALGIGGDTPLAEPEDIFERDTYRSYSRGVLQGNCEPPRQ